jgi:DNA-binding NtrC family response regulator
MVEAGAFRHDLWYRLCAFVLNVPPLHERKDDTTLLAQSFLEKTCADIGCNKIFSADALTYLQTLPFSGNVRELRHIVTRAAVFSDTGTIDRQTLLSVVPTQTPTSSVQSTITYDHYDYKTARERFENDYFKAVLEKAGGNITAAAATIGMAQSNLSRKLKELGLR